MQPELAAASRALRRFSGIGPTASLGPTPERLLKARGLAHIEVAVDTEGSAAMKVPRIRVSCSPLEEMAKRRRLDADGDRAAAMLAAGRRYASLWHKVGLQTLKGQDPGKIRSTAAFAGLLVGPDGLVSGERFAENFKAYRAASDALDVAERAAVDGIVLHELALVDVGRKIGRLVTDRASAITIASHELRSGLQRLAVHFGMLDTEAPIEQEPTATDLPPEMAALLVAMDARACQS